MKLPIVFFNKKSIYLVVIFLTLCCNLKINAQLQKSGFVQAGLSTFTDKATGDKIEKNSEGSTFKWEYDEYSNSIRLWINLISFKENINGAYFNLIDKKQTEEGNEVYTFVMGTVKLTFFVHKTKKDVIGIAMETIHIISFYINTIYEK